MNTKQQLAATSREDLQAIHSKWRHEFSILKGQHLALDITRGKPGPEQLALCAELDGILAGDFRLANGSDARNYGVLPGIPEARRLGGEILKTAPAKVLAGGNSSLTLMHQYVLASHLFGLSAEPGGWQQRAGQAGGKVKFLCPVPGYDRHFTICATLGIEMLPVAMGDTGPDMDFVEEAVRSDQQIKGIWCVPRFSNPSGAVYSDSVVERCAGLGSIAAPDFRIFWDNAYAVHPLYEDSDDVACLLSAAARRGNEDSAVLFASTSKMTFAGGGVSWLATSEANMQRLVKYLGAMMIGPDKVNQLRHVRMLPNLAAVQELMRRHAEILRPRFEMVEAKLDAGLAGLGIAQWTKPGGGYFVSFDSMPGLASKIVALAGELGVKLTPAGSTWPYGRDPQDRNIRIAPSFPSVEDLGKAMDVFTLCVRLASVEAMLADRNH